MTRTSTLNHLTSFARDEVLLPRERAWPEARYRVQPRMVSALRAAVGSGRPLLVRGEPGAGKSDFARAAAAIGRRRFVSFVIQPDTEYEELLWSVDHTERLGAAQRMAVAASSDSSADGDPLAIARFVCPGPLWYAYAPARAIAL